VQPSFDPTLITPSPTKSPTLGCTNRQSELSVRIKTDRRGNKVSYSVKIRNHSGKFTRTVMGRDELPATIAIEDSRCVNIQDRCYKFRIFDKEGDGMCCQRGRGWYLFTVNGNTVQRSRFEDGRVEKKKFGNCT